MTRRWEIELAGRGGQGLAVAGLILAEAAGVYEGKEVALTEVHGIASRGGPSRSEVIISDEEIDFPAVTRPDVLLAMTQKDCDIYSPSLREGGVLIVDDTVSLVPILKSCGTYRLPLLRAAREELRSPISVNIVALGALAALAPVVSREALAKAIVARMPRTAEMNLRALEAGAQMARRAMEALGGKR
ncbi:MAG: 2-oxoacid:acceptor oxidoreductase family protein [Chloroflexi bacterium]|nr:2-oxoacid:acceptor oxidoreductase family protein [Chloroflexota bacterium]MDA8187289.1 2-oxoacid:acceptor oxidoreductase family protein [Dehalococcoidales bacterium]